jgi:hypothetical protein
MAKVDLHSACVYTAVCVCHAALVDLNLNPCLDLQLYPEHWELEHWEQRLGVKLAQEETSLVLGAVASARANAERFSGRKASPGWSPTDCMRQPLSAGSPAPPSHGQRKIR